MKADVIVAKINKKFGDNTIGFAKDLKYAEVPRLLSGSLFLDWALGKNYKDNTAGWPQGRLIELYGPESTGKSLICLKTIVQAQKKGFDCAYIDAENSFDRTFAQKLGVDTDKLMLSRESKAESVLDLVCQMVQEVDTLKVVVVDSLASLIPNVVLEKGLEENQMASMARIMSKGLPKLVSFNKNNALIIFINQLRTNPGAGMYANPEYTPGGNALKYYSSIRVDIRRGDWIFDDEEKKKKLGQVVKFRIVKNKSDVAQREGYFKFLYNTGEIDKVDELISLGLLNGKIIRKGPFYYVGNSDDGYKGREEMEMEMKKDQKVYDNAVKVVFA